MLIRSRKSYEVASSEITPRDVYLQRRRFIQTGVSAFAGLERMQAAYAHAIAARYRFYSYGDASLIWRPQ